MLRQVVLVKNTSRWLLTCLSWSTGRTICDLSCSAAPRPSANTPQRSAALQRYSIHLTSIFKRRFGYISFSRVTIRLSQANSHLHPTCEAYATPRCNELIFAVMCSRNFSCISSNNSPLSPTTVGQATLHPTCASWQTGLSLHTCLAAHKSGASSKKKNYFMGERVRAAKVHPIMKHKSVILIDENGTRLDKFDSKVALGIAEGNGLEVKMVGRDDKIGLPVFRMISKKALYDEEKMLKIKNRPSRHNVVKEVTIGSRITEHDLSHKVKWAREMLEKGYSVRIIIELKISKKRASEEQVEEEEKRRSALMDDVTSRFSDMGFSFVKFKEYGKKKDPCTLFRPNKMVKVGEPGEPAGR